MKEEVGLEIDRLIQIYKEMAKQLSHQRLKMIAEHLREHELSLNQLSILNLVLHNERYSSIQLANHLNLKAASITYLVDTLEKRGLVTRTVNPEDGRSHYICLTEQGRQIAVVPESDDWIRERLEKANPEDLTIIHLAIRVLTDKLLKLGD